MIRIKTPEEIEKMAISGALVAECLHLAKSMVEPGISTGEINKAVEDLIRDRGAEAAFKGFPGGPGVPPFPAACCMSVDDQVVHGFPDDTPLQDGQIISVDIGVLLNGWYGDAARTFLVGDSVDPKVIALVNATRESLEHAIELLVPGEYLSNIGHSIQTYVEKRGYSVVRDLVGHGIGRDLHESPQVPNYGKRNKGLILREGMVIAVEPMINMGTWRIKVLDDYWTVVTADGSPSAHFEHIIAITSDGPRILTPDPI